MIAVQTDLRSIVIDHLKHKFPSSAVAFVYFDYELKSGGTQSADNVAADILKQVLLKFADKTDETLKRVEAGLDKPDLWEREDLCRLIVECSQKGGPVYVVLDGADECKDSETNALQALINVLVDNGIRTLVTSCDGIPHGIKSEVSATLPVFAHREDIEKCVHVSLAKVSTLDPDMQIPLSLEEETVDAICESVEEAGGM